MGTGELDDPVSPGQPACRFEALYGVGGLCDERFGLGASRLAGHGGIADQLGQAACRAQPHLQWMAGVWAGVPAIRELVASGLVAQVEHQVAGPPTAPPTDEMSTHVEQSPPGRS
jgi:hypothetical protein